MRPHLHQAVRYEYSNAVNIYGNDVDSLVVLDANNNTISINTANVTSQLATLQTQYTTNLANKAAAANSAISKLTALGLTADEIAALRGQ